MKMSLDSPDFDYRTLRKCCVDLEQLVKDNPPLLERFSQELHAYAYEFLRQTLEPMNEIRGCDPL
jgi:hypothetical protein